MAKNYVHPSDMERALIQAKLETACNARPRPAAASSGRCCCTFRPLWQSLTQGRRRCQAR